MCWLVLQQLLRTRSRKASSPSTPCRHMSTLAPLHLARQAACRIIMLSSCNRSGLCSGLPMSHASTIEADRQGRGVQKETGCKQKPKPLSLSPCRPMSTLVPIRFAGQTACRLSLLSRCSWVFLCSGLLKRHCSDTKDDGTRTGDLKIEGCKHITKLVSQSPYRHMSTLAPLHLAKQTACRIIMLIRCSWVFVCSGLLKWRCPGTKGSGTRKCVKEREGCKQKTRALFQFPCSHITTLVPLNLAKQAA